MAVDGASAIAQLTEHAPDVVVLDISLPDRTGVDVASQMSREKPHVAIIALSAYSEEPYVRAMLEAGARGYVLKVRAVDELVRAIHHVAGGHIYLGSQLDVHAGADAPR
jgi:two-component system response regulator DesR